jgi:hypothetical protein
MRGCNIKSLQKKTEKKLNQVSYVTAQGEEIAVQRQ